MDGLSSFALVREALAEIHAKWRTFLRALLLPALAVIGLVAIKLHPPEELTGLLGVYGFLVWRFLFWALGLPFYALFAIVCHRIVILGASSLPNPFGLFWSDRETRFLGWIVKFTLLSWGLGLVMAPLVIGMKDTVLGVDAVWHVYVLVGIPAMYLFSRTCLVFPATAVDQGASLREAWHLSAGNGFRLLIAILVPIPVLMAPMILSTILFGDEYSVIDGVILNVVPFLMLTISTCVISVAYKKLSTSNSFAIEGGL